MMYLPWFNHFGWSLKDWWENQTAMLAYHRSLQTTALDVATNAYTPDAPVLLARLDVALHVATGQLLHARRGRRHRAGARGREPRDLLGEPLGDPVRHLDVVATGRLARRVHRDCRCWRSSSRGSLVTRPQFFFYVAPITPFMVLAIAYVMRDLASATIVLREPGGETVESARHPYLPFVWGYVAAGDRPVPVVLAGPDRQPDLADGVAGAGLVPRMGLT